MGSTWFEIHSSIPITNPRIDNPRTGSGEELINDSSCNHDTNCGLVQWSAQSVLRRREQIAFRPGVSHYLPKHRRDKRREKRERKGSRVGFQDKKDKNNVESDLTPCSPPLVPSFPLFPPQTYIFASSLPSSLRRNGQVRGDRAKGRLLDEPFSPPPHPSRNSLV